MLRLLGRERSGQGFFSPILNHLPILAIMRLIQQVYADAIHALGIPSDNSTVRNFPPSGVGRMAFPDDNTLREEVASRSRTPQL
jgi:hypothetical protein